MTNNHVLASRDIASGSIAEFGYEDDSTVTRVALKPDGLFITHKELDFTIVGCEPDAIADITHIPLLRNPATITRNERVNIIQHPSGRTKEVAIYKNNVIRVQDKVLHYRTDTEPGSSGSPVFNNSWELVGLHHAGWTEQDGRSTNEGIRISSIVSHLISQRRQADSNNEHLESLLSGINDTSPYLGFFDAWGVGSDNEVEVPDSQGTPEFADFGVWNTEHFNKNVSNQRVEDVADVLSRLSMDVMGLTEVQDKALDKLKITMANRGHAVDYVYLDTPFSHDLAVLFDLETSKVSIPDWAGDFKNQFNKRTDSGKTVFPRHPLIALCEVGEGDNPPVKFVKIVVHLKAFGDQQSRARRRMASEILTEVIEDIRNEHELPVVLGGDFNEQLNTDVLGALKSSPDLFVMTADDATTDAISFVGNSHRSLIDHIMVSNDVRLGSIQGDDAAIVRLDQSVQDFSRDVSDHVPIVFRMIYRESPLTITVSKDQAATVKIPPGSNTLEFTFN